MARSADLIAEGRADSLLYLAASHPLLDLVTNQLLDGNRNRGVWGSVPVHLFRGFVRHVLETAVEATTGLSLAPRVPIDREELPLKQSLISQLIKRLARAGTIKAIAPLANRDGCINTVASLIGEIERAARPPADFDAIVRARVRDFEQGERGNQAGASSPTIHLQRDFDREIGLIYASYWAALDRFHMTDDDTDQLRALAVLRGDVDGIQVELPWLSEIRLLVLDGFFDFTPVQGEMLRLLIPAIPDVIVNLNRDDENREIFRPFSQTIDQLYSMAPFEIVESRDSQTVAGALSPLRARLFNTAAAEGANSNADSSDESAAADSSELTAAQVNIRCLMCSDRETEIRAIAREIKRLVLVEGYSLADIAVVVRQRASYADAIARIFDDQAIACSLERRLSLGEVPAVRAALKLLNMLAEMARDKEKSPKVSDLADLIKSDYFRLGDGDLASLRDRFVRDHAQLLSDARSDDGDPGIGRWDSDQLENVVAYVGGELRADSWLHRAGRLTAPLRAIRPALEASDEVDAITESAEGEDLIRDIDHDADREPEVGLLPSEHPGSHRKPKPSTEVHPASIAWSALMVERLAHLLGGFPREGRPRELRDALMEILDALRFAVETRKPLLESRSGLDFDRAMVDVRGLEGVRRALASAVRAIEMAEEVVPEGTGAGRIMLGAFIDEVIRCIAAQTLRVGGGDRDGLQVLEATDVRGLRFRAVFIAGLIEGGFPLRASRDWIYPHEERERLKQYGLTLEDISPDTLLKEEHYFYQAACRGTERLYLTRPLLVEENADAETVASYYIDELRQAAAPAHIEQEIVRRHYDGREVAASSTAAELAISLVRLSERHLHRADREGLPPRQVVAAMIEWAAQEGYLSRAALERIAIERERAGPSFGRFDGEITDARLLEMTREQYGPRHVFSASELSLYGKCPFRFFAQRVLRLEPRGEAALDLPALDAGRLLHEVLRRFFEKHRRQRLAPLDREPLRQELQAVADQVFDEHEQSVPPLNPHVWRIDREIRKVLLDRVLAYEIAVEEATRAKDVRAAYFELAFGMKSEHADPDSREELLELRRAGRESASEERALVRGQIDRVDVARDGIAVAYDYKLSRGASLADMEEGRDLQIGIYLAALERVLLPGHVIAGGGYYVMRGSQNRRNRGLYRARMSGYTGVGARADSNLTDADWSRMRARMEERIWEFIDAMRAGRFVVAPSSPKDTCPTCDYSAVCRFDKYRISRKKAQESQKTDRREPADDA